MSELYNLEHYFHKQCEYGLNRLVDYVVQKYGAIWTQEVRDLLKDDAFKHFHFPVFNETEEFTFYGESMDYLLAGCSSAEEGAEQIINVIEWLNGLEETEFGEILWSEKGSQAYHLANHLHYWIGYIYAVPKLNELNNMFRAVHEVA